MDSLQTPPLLGILVVLHLLALVAATAAATAFSKLFGDLIAEIRGVSESLDALTQDIPPTNVIGFDHQPQQGEDY
jgi:hypothetical protein